MSFFPLPQRATLLKRKTHTPGFERSGQLKKPEHESTGITFKCLFFGIVGGKRGGVKQEFDQTIAFYCESTVPIAEGDIVTNVKGIDDFEGDHQFEVLRVTKVTNFTGRVHHLSCKLRGRVGPE